MSLFRLSPAFADDDEMSLLFVISFYTGFGFGGKHEASKGAEKSTLLTSRRFAKNQ